MNLKYLVAVSAVAVSAFAFGANPPGFIDDYDVAIKRAAAENKTILAVFSGSDWCYWCKMLDQQFLSKQEFTDAVTNDLVCLYIDSPKDKSLISEKAREQNPKLVKKYGIKGYPSVMFIDSKGEKIADAKRMKLTPAEWGKYLVAAAKPDPAKEKLAEQHLKPFRDRMEAVMEKCKTEVEEVQKKGDPTAMQAEFMRIFVGLQTQFGAIKKDVEAHQFPKELEAEKAELLRELNSISTFAPGMGK